MAARGLRLKHAGCRLFTMSTEAPAAAPAIAGDDMDESDIWGGGSAAVDHRKPTPAGRNEERMKRYQGSSTVAASVPVRIPDWSKILRGEYRAHSCTEKGEEGEEEEEEYGPMIPPHELMWRSRAASLSVHEGVGRTLKGRDLSRVRNAIWEKTGFQA